jgi:hypothetical protein
MHGLLDMGDIGFYGHGADAPTFNPGEIAPFADSFGGIVLNVRWDQLQPDAPTAIEAGNPIDQDLAAVRTYNQQNPDARLKVKLRVWGGFDAPIWAQNIGGAPITITDTQHGRSGTIGRWWEPAYIQAWRKLQAMLAGRYGGNPLIHEVAVTSCASATDEPFVPFDSTGIAALQAAGYTDSEQENCLMGTVKDYAAWKRTAIDFTFNPFHEFNSGTGQSDPKFTDTVMQQCASSPHCVLSNHALNDPLASADTTVYQEMQALYAQDPAGTLTDFQTASPCQLQWCGAIANAVTLFHASSVELWPGPVVGGGFTELTTDELANLADAIVFQSPPASSPCPPPPPGCPSSTPTPAAPS